MTHEMINAIGVIAGILFFIKIFLHLILAIPLKQNIDVRSGHSPTTFFLLLPIMGEVPKRFKALKLITNIIYGTIWFLVIVILLYTYL
jgi:hypothetical protein